MSRALLDINVLLAALDSDHIDHTRATEWLAGAIDSGWASCAITQNGFVRVVSQPRYPSPITPSEAIELLVRACAEEHHEYWLCDVTLLEPRAIVRDRLHGPRQVTDAYLLALAVRHAGRFVTFDDTIPLTAVRGATRDHLFVL